jgi:hypothetical protein
MEAAEAVQCEGESGEAQEQLEVAKGVFPESSESNEVTGALPSQR